MYVFPPGLFVFVFSQVVNSAVGSWRQRGHTSLRLALSWGGRVLLQETKRNATLSKKAEQVPQTTLQTIQTKRVRSLKEALLFS